MERVLSVSSTNIVMVKTLHKQFNCRYTGRRHGLNHLSKENLYLLNEINKRHAWEGISRSEQQKCAILLSQIKLVASPTIRQSK